MTAIVGLAHNNRIWIGGDSALSDGDDTLVISRDPKVFRRADGLIIGFCGSLRFGQLVALTQFPRRGPDVDLWVRQDVCKALRQGARDAGFELGCGADQDDSQALLGVSGELYVLDVGAVAYRPADAFAAVGSGSSWALGAMHVSRGRPKARLVGALEAAERFCRSVRGPWVIVGA
jgi:ATP-dependent protease HslVU (ClpYQ) peptidase subunit